MFAINYEHLIQRCRGEETNHLDSIGRVALVLNPELGFHALPKAFFPERSRPNSLWPLYGSDMYGNVEKHPETPWKEQKSNCTEYISAEMQTQYRQWWLRNDLAQKFDLFNSYCLSGTVRPEDALMTSRSSGRLCPAIIFLCCDTARN